MASTVYIKCPLCLETHIIDKYGWVDGCRGYMDLADFELITKMEYTGESIKYG
jgi:hypothetical protein